MIQCSQPGRDNGKQFPLPERQMPLLGFIDGKLNMILENEEQSIVAIGGVLEAFVERAAVIRNRHSFFRNGEEVVVLVQSRKRCRNFNASNSIALLFQLGHRLCQQVVDLAEVFRELPRKNLSIRFKVFQIDVTRNNTPSSVRISEKRRPCRT